MHPLLTSKGKRPRTGSVIRCPECQGEFYVSPKETGRRVYCSRKCKEKVQERQVTRTCPTCGESYTKAESSAGRYCSRSCYNKSRKATKACRVCGKPVATGRLTYCSAECHKAGRRGGETVPCETCKKPMYVEPALRKSKRFCSRQCKNRSMEIAGPGHRCQRSDGYMQVYYPTHPDASRSGFVLEHRLVAEQKTGRRLTRQEHVHHINGIRDDNRPENLQVIMAGAHAHVSIKQGVDKRKRMRDELEEYRRRFGPLPDTDTGE